MKRGFTLAEVLITLTIIGVVASMTIPSLMQSTNDLQYKVAWKKEFSSISQAFTKLRIENGSFQFILDGTSNVTYEALKEQMNIVNDCGYWSDQGSCYLYDDFDYVDMDGTSMDPDNFDDGQFVLADGAFIMIEDHSTSSEEDIVWVDVNGHNKGPNTLGKDLFAIRVLKDKIVPAGATDSDVSLSTCESTGNTTNALGWATEPVDGAGCSAQYLLE